jgi:hypothetical protein
LSIDIFGRADKVIHPKDRIKVLKEHAAGMSASDLCRKHGLSDATFYIYGRFSRCKSILN